MPTLEEIEERHPNVLSNIPAGNWERKALPTVLQGDEFPEGAVYGVYNNRIGILVVTDRRAVFVDKGLFGIKVEDFQFDRITSVTHKTGMMMGEITLTVAGNACIIKNILKAAVTPLADLIRKKVQASSQSVPAPTVGLVNEIARLASLRDAGALTDEEFTLAKQKLLSGAN